MACVTCEQIEQVKTLVETAIRLSGADRNNLQRVIANGDNLQEQLVLIIQELGGCYRGPSFETLVQEAFNRSNPGMTPPG